MDIFIVLAGFVVGLVVGLTGVGGGSLMTPLLIFAFGVKPAIAVGTDLLFAAITKGSGVLALLRQKTIAWPVVTALCAGSIPAALLSVWWLHKQTEAGVDVDTLVKIVLGVALLLTAVSSTIKLLRGKKTVEVESEIETAQTLKMSPIRILLTVLLGAIIGAMVAVSSVGAGAVGVIALMILYPNLPMHRVVASDIAYAVPLTLVTGLSHAGIGTVDWSLLLTLLVGSIPGIWLGSHWVQRVPQNWIRVLLAAILSVAGTKLLMSV